MNTNKTFLFLSLAFILLASSACGPAAATITPTPETAINTIIAETAQAAVLGTLTQIALSRPSDTPTPFFTETPIQTGTLIPLPTSNKPMISVSKETNCRLGPDTVYERVGQLDPGIMAEVFALDPTKYYYFIQNPSKPDTYCWIWGFYVTTVNDFVGLPIYTPAYTPIPVKTSTPGLTATATVTGTIFPTVTGTITSVAACTSVSYFPADNQKFQTGESQYDFIWIVKNTGNTLWKHADVNFKFVSGSDTKLTNRNIFPLPNDIDIAPGEIVKLQIDLKVPATPGKYTESWALFQNSTKLCSLILTIEAVAP